MQSILLEKRLMKLIEDLDEMERGKLMNAFKLVEKDVVRKSILSNEPRIDGRDSRYRQTNLCRN